MSTGKSGKNAAHGSCPCCGAIMVVERELKHSILVRCTQCGISDTRIR